jgi:hypothetical protein
MQRPGGVTLIAILSLLSGLWGVIKGLAWLGIGGVIAGGLTVSAHPIAGAMVGFVAVVFGVLALATGVFALVFGFGAFGLRPWAWTMGVLTHAVIVIWSLLAALGPARLSERWLGLLVSGAILYYLTRPDIKAAFGRG